jgi:hypothetical protein
MNDPFLTVMFRQRLATGGAVLAVAALVLTIGYLQVGTVNTGGTLAKAEVLRVGTRPAARVAGGNLPVVTVRMADGSVRQVQATWADVENCVPGRWLSLVENGAALQVARPGCSEN